MDFITIDFEITNINYNSACSLGMVFVKNNEIVDQKYFVIKPPTSKMDPEMSEIHGLTMDDLINAPTFDHIWNEISHYFHNDTYIIAHNAQFDMSVLRNCLNTYSLDVPDFKYVCSIPISTRACRGEGIGNSLKERTERFGVELEDHHNALADAKACAELVIACIKSKRRKSIHTYFSTFRSIPIRSFTDLKYNSTFYSRNSGKSFNRVSVTEIIPDNNNFNENHPLFDKTIVFTGELKTIERRDAMQKVVNIGAIIRSAVSRKTDFLVVGKQDKTVVGKTGQSSKERKASELIGEGFEIEVLDEERFFEILKDGIAS